MGEQKRLAMWQLLDGYSSARSVLDGGDFCQSGSENVLFSMMKRPRSFKGMTAVSGSGYRQAFNFDAVSAGLVDHSGSPAKGSIFMLGAGKTYAIIGSGDGYLDGVSQSITASTVAQMRLLRSGLYTGSGTGPYQFGLAQPDAVELAIGTYGDGTQVTGQGALTGKLKGTYSAAITRIRSTTGAESNRSTTSAIITASAQGQWARLTFPLVDSNGQDRWGVYVTLAGFGSIGPQLFYIEIRETDLTTTRTLTGDVHTTSGDQTVTSATGNFTTADIGRQMAITSGAGSSTPYIISINSATSVEVDTAPGHNTTTGTAVVTQAVDGILRSIPLEWLDVDLVGGALAPIDNDAPNAAWFGFSLQDVAALVGSGGDQTTGVATVAGNVIEVSRPGFPEAFPSDTRLFLPETPTAVMERSADNYAFIWGLNSLCACTYGGAGPIPLDLSLIWNNTGIATQHNACIVDGRPYAMTGTGLVRMGVDGQPEREWAIDIAGDIEGLTPSTFVLAYDANSRTLIVASGAKQWCFNLVTEKWSTPLNMATLVAPISGNAVAAVTIAGSAKISMLASTTFTAFVWDQGSGSSWKIVTSWQNAGTPNFKTVMYLAGAFRHDVAASSISFAVYATNRNREFDLTTPRRTWLQYVQNASNGIAIRPKKLDITGAYAFAAYMSGQSAGSGSAPVEIELSGTISNVRV